MRPRLGTCWRDDGGFWLRGPSAEATLPVMAVASEWQDVFAFPQGAKNGLFWVTRIFWGGGVKIEGQYFVTINVQHNVVLF